MTVAHICLAKSKGEALLESITDIMAYTMERRDEDPVIRSGSSWGCASDWNDARTGRSNID
jgi:hypothetical protein